VSRIRDFFQRRRDFVPGEHQPRPMRAGVIGLVLLTAGMVMAYTHTIPFLPEGGTLVRAEFIAPNSVNERTKVRVNGIGVGQVDHLEPARGGRTSIVVMRIKNDSLKLHSDASARVRPNTILSGNFEVELDPGSPSAPLLGDRTIPLARTGTQPDWDDFNQPYGKNTRLAQREMLQGLNDTFAGPHPPVGRTLKKLGPSLSVIGRGADSLRGQETGELQKVVASTGKTMDALSRQRGALEGLVRGGDRTLGATARSRRALGEMIALSPAALDSTTVTMRRLSTTLDHLDPLVAELRPGARRLGAATRAIRPGLDETERLLRAAAPVLRATGPTMTQLASMGREGVPVVHGLQPTLNRLDRELLPFLGRRDPDTRLLNYQSIGPFFSGLGSVGGEFDGDGYNLHFATALGPDSAIIPCGPDLNLEQRKRCDLLNEVFPVGFGGSKP
jgi:virulence factor Mce-like protein